MAEFRQPGAVMPEGSSVVRDGVRIIQGTPKQPLRGPTLFLRILRVNTPDKPPKTRSSLAMARPGAGAYVIKELIPDMELDANAALDKAIAIAKRGDVAELYLNADLSKLPPQSMAAVG
jgi:hypothetical protein